MPSPPRFFLRLFRWFCRPALRIPIEGDIVELYLERVREKGKKRADLHFMKDVLLLFRKDIIRPLDGTFKLNRYGMLKNDIKTSLRTMKREKLYTFVNGIGLLSGFVLAILILIYVRFEQSYEHYNPTSERVVRITMDYLDGETLIDQDCETYHNLGPMIKDEFPEVVEFARAFDFELSLEIDGKTFKEPTAYAVDPSFLKMLGHPLLLGDAANALEEPNHMVLTTSTAKKFFGTTDVIGKIIPNGNNSLKVVGVVADSPPNTHLKFNVLVSYSYMEDDIKKREDPWDSNDTFTYLELGSSDQYSLFQQHLKDLSNRLRELDHIPDERIVSEKILDIHLYSNKSYEPEQNGSATTVFLLLGVALLVILIAILNYINLSTAKALDRAKEVGIRKVIGSSVLQLRMKFFVESFLLNFLAAAAAIVIIWLISEPYKELVGLPLSLEVISNSETWVLLGSLMLVSAVLSGIFPAYLMGSFKPIQVLKGKLSPALGNGALRKVLVAVQFCIAIFLLIQTFIASEQLEYMLQKDLGMDTEQVVVISIPPVENEKASITSFQNELNSRASFTNTAVSNPVPGLPTGTMSSSTNISLDRETKELKNNFFIYAIDSNFFQTMEMEMIAGNDFSQASNYEFPFIVNEEALRIWGIADPEEVLQEKSSFWGRKHTLVGVVKNFHQLGVKSAHLPMIFVKCNCESDYLSVKLGSGNPLQQVQELEEVYSQHYPNTTFDSFFLDQNFEAQYQSEQQTRKIFSALSVFALLITCLGLFGLSSYTVSKRTKEIGIRKVLGASAKQIIVLLAKDFVWLSLISSVIAIPVTYLLIQNWLEQYAFRIDLNPWLFALPAGFVLLVSFLTVFSKTLKASTLDPVQSLRDE